MAAAIAWLHEERERLGRRGEFAIGGGARPLYIGRPSWDIGEHAVSGTPEELAGMLREWASVGATQLQLRFRVRDVEELVDQLARFGDEVRPLVG